MMAGVPNRMGQVLSICTVLSLVCPQPVNLGACIDQCRPASDALSRFQALRPQGIARTVAISPGLSLGVPGAVVRQRA